MHQTIFAAALLAAVAMAATPYTGPISGGTIADDVTVGAGHTTITIDGCSITGTVTLSSVDANAVILFRDTSVTAATGDAILFTTTLADPAITFTNVAVSAALGNAIEWAHVSGGSVTFDGVNTIAAPTVTVFVTAVIPTTMLTESPTIRTTPLSIPLPARTLIKMAAMTVQVESTFLLKMV